MSLTKQLSILAGLALLVAVVLWWDLPGFSKMKPGAERPASGPAEQAAAPVIAMPVGLASSAAVVEAVGTGDAVKSVTLFPEAAGQVTGILFRAGDRVEQGDPLLRLDSEDEELAVDLAKVRLQDARQQLDRYENTAPSGAVSTSEVDQARTAVSAARIELAQAELALRKRTLRAPFDGVVSIPDVSVGDQVNTSTAISTLDDRSVLLVDFEVPESLASGVQEGAPLQASTWARPGERFEGVVDSVASRIDDQTRTLRVRGRIENENDQLRTGMSFNIRLPLQGQRLPSVPSIAVQWDRQGAYVWRVVDNNAERVEVDVIKREDLWILVDAPLDPGDLIVIEGVQRLQPGREVDVTVRDTLADTGDGDGA
ncbi:MAG TPA: efflux RND transporter periplasmic adaptor subunit [Arenicellales bacterium]|nr:efflux RND transporter periplasmic adaptor subunit [Arenicellales bacterium]